MAARESLKALQYNLWPGSPVLFFKTKHIEIALVV